MSIIKGSSAQKTVDLNPLTFFVPLCGFTHISMVKGFQPGLSNQRTAGLKAAQARGQVGGKPKGLSQSAESTAAAAETLYQEGKRSTRQIATMLGISKSTLYSYLRHRGVEIGIHRRKPIPKKVD
jgi:hypothetical protein